MIKDSSVPGVWVLAKALVDSDADPNLVIKAKRALFLTIAVLGFGILNNVGATMQSFVMPGYPAWLLYFTTFLYTVAFGIIAARSGEHPFSPRHMSWRQQSQFLWLGLWTTLNGLCFQFSAAWVNAELQQILSNLSIVFLFVLSMAVLGDRFRKIEVFGGFLVLLGVVVGTIPSLLPSQSAPSGGQQSNAWYWVVAFVLSIVFSAIEQVWQDRSFRPPFKVSEATCLFWYNLYSIPAYFIAINFEAFPYVNGTPDKRPISTVWQNQGKAFECYFGMVPHDQLLAEDAPCKPLAWLWPSIFVIGYIGMFYFNALLIKEFNAFFANIIQAMIPPLAGAVFAISAIVGQENYDKLSIYIVLGFLLTTVGVLVKGVPDESQMAAKTDENKAGAACFACCFSCGANLSMDEEEQQMLMSNEWRRQRALEEDEIFFAPRQPRRTFSADYHERTALVDAVIPKFDTNDRKEIEGLIDVASGVAPKRGMVVNSGGPA